MCGINGALRYMRGSDPIDIDEVLRTRDYMALRGPDGAGLWIGEGQSIALAHRRLAIVDLSQLGSQPMQSADGRFITVFNGEIYNYAELRKDLISRGHVFHSSSDAEVLAPLYLERGTEMVHDLRGMYAFAIWDCKEKNLFLARDPFGIKPLYYADDGHTLRFASQVKALLAGGNIDLEADPAGWVGFYLFGSVPDPFTTYKNITAVEAGEAILISAGRGIEKNRIASLGRRLAGLKSHAGSDRDDDSKVVQSLLLDSVRHHLVADVPVGAFLSAGIDSGALVGLMRDAGQNDIQTVTLGFQEFENDVNDEVRLAALVAEQYHTRHHARFVTEKEFVADLPLILHSMDQPTIDGINAWFVSKAAHEIGLKVAISGLGGDELFGSYPTFRDLPRIVGLLAIPGQIPLARMAYHALLAGARYAFGGRFPQLQHPKANCLLEYGATYPGAYLLRRGLFMPHELSSILDPEFVAQGMKRLDPLAHIAAILSPEPEGAFAKVSLLESEMYMRNQLLRDTDWASMAHSLEVRVPLVDFELFGGIANRRKKLQRTDVKRNLGLAPTSPLPETIMSRPKTGFSTPISTWLKRNPSIGRWREQPILRDERCPWARRWAYEVGGHFMTSAVPKVEKCGGALIAGIPAMRPVHEA